MTYQEVIDTIENKRRFGNACGRDITMELMELLGHPEEGMTVLHIAGTNGKGSTAAFMSSILRAADLSSKDILRVGTFVSPHLKDFTERIQVDGVQIPQEDATRIGEMLLKLQPTLSPTMFDYCLAMAMVYFKEQGVTHVVLETGLGGSKDSTSGLSVVPRVCAITSIGFDHTAILGDTYEAIAAEKAGIIKESVGLVVIGNMPHEASQVIIDRCNQLSVNYVLSKELDDTVKLGLFGQYQKRNAAVAYEAMDYVLASLFTNEADRRTVLLKGLAEAKWPGRMDIVSKEPYVMLDGAHNPQGVQALFDSLVAQYPGEKFTFITAVMADKDYISMMRIMEPIAARFYTATVDYSRSLQGQELAKKLKEDKMEAEACQNYEEAYSRACEHSEKIVVFGSLYFVGEVLKLYE